MESRLYSKASEKQTQLYKGVELKSHVSSSKKVAQDPPNKFLSDTELI